MTGHLDPAWITAQRWFRAKQRPVASVSEVDRAALGGAAVLTIVEVTYADGGAQDSYLLPLVEDREPENGDGAWAAIVRAMADDAHLRGTSGRFSATHTPALDDLVPSAHAAAAALSERRLGVEQSNTSVVLGDRLILKLYRLLEPGDNPDLEISAFLTDAGFGDTPALAGALTYVPDGGGLAAAAMLQAFVPSNGDAWTSILGALESDPSRATAQAAGIGRVTAAMHVALRSAPDDPAFPARPATDAETAAWRASAEQQLAQAVTAVSGEAHDRLVALAPRLTARFADTFGAATGEAQLSRIHGDYHLGQLLARPDGGFSVIDFEGEPARPLHARRQPWSPLRDVAGMLRSLDYAARTAEAGQHAPGFAAEAWLSEARAAFLGAYGDIGPDGKNLLAAFELEKACYEVRYEAGNRPDWLWLPLAALERLGERNAS